MKIIYPVYKPFLCGNEKKYVNECLDSTWISSKGHFISRFESEFSKYINIKHSTTVSNGTVALHLALLALGIGPGDEVIVPTLTYIASVNAIVYTGAKPVFVDSDLTSWMCSVDDVKKKISKNTKAILLVHLYGNSCDLRSFMNLANQENIFIIEDCAEAFGTLYDNKHVGTFGHISTFSFFGNKTITTGEGGMVVTNDSSLFDRAVRLKGQGLAMHRQYWHDIVGYNYRMTNICAAIGLAQLEQADMIIEKKIKIAKLYKEFLKGLPLEFNCESDNIKNSFWMVSVLLNSNDIREKFRNHLELSGIETRPLFFPVHTMPMYSKIYTLHPNAESIGLRGVNLPSYPELGEDDVYQICKVIKNFFDIS